MEWKFVEGRGGVIADIERDERNMINTARLMKS